MRKHVHLGRSSNCNGWSYIWSISHPLLCLKTIDNFNIYNVMVDDFQIWWTVLGELKWEIIIIIKNCGIDNFHIYSVFLFWRIVVSCMSAMTKKMGKKKKKKRKERRIGQPYIEN